MDKVKENTEGNAEYLSTKINPLITKLMRDILKDKPNEPIDFIIGWMQREKRGENETFQPLKFTTIFQDLKLDLKKPYLDIFDSKNQEKGAVESDEEEEDDNLTKEEMDKMKAKRKATQRIGVSAEVFGENNKKSDFKPKTIPKSKEEKEKLLLSFEKIFLFSPLSTSEKLMLADACEKKEFKKGEMIITQGEEGDFFYILMSGESECYLKPKDSQQEQFLKNYQAGDSFGELALLYNCPRVANIRASADCQLFALDRTTFNHIVKEAAMRKREKFEKIFKGVDLMKKLDSYELGQIIDAIKEREFKTGERIIEQGAEGNEFFILLEGKAVASKQSNGKSEDVLNYVEGDYFGELALMKNEVRAASVTAQNDVKVGVIDRESFIRLLGQADDILQRGISRYN